MTTLFKRKQVPPDAELAETEVTQPAAGSDRLLLLTPEGGSSYRFFAFPTIEAAQAYVRGHALELPREGVVALWALDSEMGGTDRHATSGGPVEAVVMIRDPNAPATVALYTFVDMEAALSFLRQSMAGGLDPRLVLLHWAELVSLDLRAAPATDRAPAEGVPAEPEGATSEPSPSPPAAPADAAAPVQSAGQRRGGAKTVRQALAGPKETPPATTARRDEPAGETKKRGAPPLAGILAQIHAWPGWDGLAVRMVAASRLNQEVYEDLKRDREATGRAALIVGLVVLAAGIGAAGSGLASTFWHASAALVGWGAYASTVYVVGIWMFGGRRVQPVELFQAAGLASSPGLLLILGAVPVYGPLFALAVTVWVPVATAIALTPVLELDRQSALLTVTVGWFPLFAISQLVPAVL